MAINAISGLNSLTTSLNDVGKVGNNGNDSVSFGDYLKQALESVNNLQNDSQKLTDSFAVGKTDNIADVMIASEKADIALQFTMQIRNKILDAYSEIMRMQI